MTEFYTYIHAKPDGSIFYVGKGCGGRSHMLTQRSQHHRRMIKKYGVRIFVFPCESEEQAFADEIQQIAQLRAEGFELVNRTDGGDGTSGYRHTDEAKAKVSKAQTGRPSTLKGKKLSDEVRKKVSDGVKKWAEQRNPEDRSKIATAATVARWAKISAEKRTVSAEVRAKISASRKGTPAWNKGISPSDEVRAKMSESGKKKVMTAEHRAKIVAAQRTPEMRARQAAAKIGHTPWNKGIKNTSLSHPESSQETATLSSTQSTILSTTKFNTTT